MRRRAFLRIGGAWLAGLAPARPWAARSAGADLPARSRPADPVVLRSSRLEVLLDRKDGLPYEYRLLPGPATLRGEDFGNPIRVTICDRSNWVFLTAPVAAASVKATGRQADFSFRALAEGKPAASFVLRYLVDGATVYVTMEDVEEHRGHELMEVAMPRLVTVRQEDGPAWLAHGDDGGSLVFLSEAKPGELPANTFWGSVLASLPVVMVGTDRAICVEEVTAYMDGTALTVAGEPGHRRASLGTVKTYRVNGSLCNENTGPGTPRVCGNQRTPNLLVGQKSLCRLDFLAKADGQSSPDWLDAAKLVRERMPANPTHYYDNRFVYGIHCDEPRFEKPATTFEQCERLVHDVAALTDQALQVVHLWGWQYRGKDTGYPAVAEVNPRLGGYQGLMRLLRAGPSHNSTVTFSDNYDDGYRSSPAWDPNIIARRPDGELWKSRNWTGEDSYVVGLAKYMQGPGPERIRYTSRHYELRETIHVDVLSYFPVRNDWDPAHPASGIKNLFEGRYRVIEEFKKQGLDVSSEAMRYAFIGKIGNFWHITTPRPCPFGGQPIPLQPLIYRWSAVWGEGGRHAGLADRLLRILFYNACPRFSLQNETDRREITDLFYLMMVPWFKIHARNIEWFRREGERTLIGLEGSSRLDLNWKNRTYSVTVDGVEIARDFGTFCQLDEGRIAFYATTERELSVPLPKGWNAANLAAFALLTDHAEEYPATVERGTVKLRVPERRPVMVYRDRAAAKERFRPTT